MQRLPSLARIVVGLLVVATLFLTACNTVRGVGKDVEKAGEAIQKGAD